MTTESEILNLSLPDAVDQRIAQLIAGGAIATPKKRKKGRLWESNLAWEYIGKFYEQYPHWFRIGLGAIPGGEENQIYAKLRRYADVVIRMPDHILIIELKMLAKPDVVGQLLNYKMLFPQTAMFEKYKDLPVKLKVVCSMVDDNTRAFIESHGIEVEIYKGKNFDTWYNEKIAKTVTQ